MPTTVEGLLDLLDQAREAEPGTRIEYRDRIASYGSAAIREVRSWLADAALVSFAIRTIEKAAATDEGARNDALVALRSIHGAAFAESAKLDAQEAIKRLGGAVRPVKTMGSTAVGRLSGPIPALIRGYPYRRRELREAGLLGNIYSGISYPAGGQHACLFSGGPNSESYGYRDMPVGSDGYRYYGEWRGTRDMSLTGGNRVILDRTPNLYLFVNEGGGVHRFEGRFMATGYETIVAEREGSIGEAIVFALERVADEVRL